MGKRARAIHGFFALSCLPASALAWDYTPTVIPGLTVLYGYLSTQHSTLELASERYPGLRDDIRAARGEFDRQFPDALAKVTRLFEGMPLSASDRALLATKALDINRGAVPAALGSEEAVKWYLQRLRDTAHGDMEKGTLQLLLAAVYEDRPAAELNSPLAQTIRTRTGANAGADARVPDVSFRMPLSWVRDPQREKLQVGTTLFAFNSEAGHGQASIDVAIRPSPASTPAGKSDAERLVDNLRFLTGTTANVETQGATMQQQRRMNWVSFSITSESNSGQTVQYGRAWFLPIREAGQTFMLLCRTAPLSEPAAEAERKRLEPLWTAVAASVVVAAPPR